MDRGLHDSLKAGQLAESDIVLVAASTKASESFLHFLNVKRVPFAVLTNNKQEQERMERLGAKHIVVVDTKSSRTDSMPEYRVGKVFLFEKSVPLCCRYLQLARKWTSQPIYVITESDNARHMYKSLGANYVIYSRNGQVSFLVP